MCPVEVPLAGIIREVLPDVEMIQVNVPVGLNVPQGRPYISVSATKSHVRNWSGLRESAPKSQLCALVMCSSPSAAAVNTCSFHLLPERLRERS